jgi:signal transduction histidine kinase
VTQRWLLGGFAAIGAAAVAASITLAALSDTLVRPALQVVLVNWITVPYLVSGLIAWWRRPASRLGPLMIAVAVVMALTTGQWSHRPVPHTIGHLVDLLPAAMFLHVFLAFPTGRLHRGLERALVIAAYAVATVLQLAKILLGSDPENALTVTQSPAATTIERIQLAAIAALVLAGAGLLVVRRRRGPRPVTVRIVDSFGLALVMVAALFVAALLQWSGFEVLKHVTFGALGLAPVAFLAGLLDARLARGGVVDLLVKVRTDPSADLRGLLAKAIRDPSLEIAYWLPKLNTWSDQAGRPVSLDGRPARIIRTGGEPVAALIFDRSFDDERELLDAVAAAAALTLENGRLQAELRGQLGRIVEAGRLERQRLERDLHDGAQQRLVTLQLELTMIAAQLTDPAAQERLSRVRGEISASLGELRDLARGIYPAVLTGHGLPVALESLAARAPVPVDLRMSDIDRLPEAVEVAAYYVVSECLANIGKHAQATTATVEVDVVDGELVVVVTDDGVGGAPALRKLADRVEALGGRLDVWSPPGKGTRVETRTPV